MAMAGKSNVMPEPSAPPADIAAKNRLPVPSAPPAHVADAADVATNDQLPVPSAPPAGPDNNYGIDIDWRN
jgi:hypothetical protein